MVVPAGHYRLAPDAGRIVLRTARDGLAATAGHDLIIDAPRWSGDLVVKDDGAPLSLEVRIDAGALTVREGSGGVRPLTDRDRREIGVTMRRLLDTGQHPEALFAATRFDPNGAGGLIEGDFTLRGKSRPLTLEVTQTGPGTYRATGSVVQSSYDITPYSGFFGTLKVRDAVVVEAEVKLPAPGEA
jgi:polyisoprenoid-binding protein YceI